MTVKFTHKAGETLLRAALDNYGRAPSDEEFAEILGVVKEVVANFVAYYGRRPFLLQEPIHQFPAIEFQDPDNPAEKSVTMLMLTVQEDSVLLLDTSEVSVDDMYDVRKVIAEAAMPEFYNDTFDTQDKMPEND